MAAKKVYKNPIVRSITFEKENLDFLDSIATMKSMNRQEIVNHILVKLGKMQKQHPEPFKHLILLD